MHGVSVIEDPRAASAALDPVRSRLLAELAAAPASAAMVAERVGLTRQQTNYHLKTLEAHGLVELAEVRMRGGISERMLQATAATFVVSPAAIAESGARPEEAGDRLSARNRFPGVVSSVEVDGVMALVEIEAGPHRITAAITRDAVEELGLVEGARATAAVKATSVMIERGEQ